MGALTLLHTRQLLPARVASRRAESSARAARALILLHTRQLLPARVPNPPPPPVPTAPPVPARVARALILLHTRQLLPARVARVKPLLLLPRALNLQCKQWSFRSHLM